MLSEGYYTDCFTMIACALSDASLLPSFLLSVETVAPPRSEFRLGAIVYLPLPFVLIRRRSLTPEHKPPNTPLFFPTAKPPEIRTA